MYYAFLAAYVLVILIHVYIVVLEMFLWKKRAAKVFGMPQALVEQTVTLAANQGLYNGFLVAALLGGFCTQAAVAEAFVLFGLGCVAVAGLYGAATASPRIFFVQTVPAGVALAFYLLAG